MILFVTIWAHEESNWELVGVNKMMLFLVFSHIMFVYIYFIYVSDNHLSC